MEPLASMSSFGAGCGLQPWGRGGGVGLSLRIVVGTSEGPGLKPLPLLAIEQWAEAHFSADEQSRSAEEQSRPAEEQSGSADEQGRFVEGQSRSAEEQSRSAGE